VRLRVDRLSCRRGGRLIFRDLSFGLGRGEALAVIGPNGAGKSSLLALLAGLLPAAAGRATAEDVGDRTLPFAQALLGAHRLSPAAALDRVGLARAADIPVSYLSAGQRRRVALARLFAAHRPLWLLDEPTAALDAAAEELLRGLLREHLAGGGLIVAATHQPLGIGETDLALGRTAVAEAW
jgi:heme exporter protein A